MSDATVVVDALGNILRFSPGFPALWDVAPERVHRLAGTAAMSMLASTLVASDERIAMLREAQRAGEPSVVQLQLRSGRVLEARLVMITPEQGLGRVSLWALRDITESWNKERELRAAAERAERDVRVMRGALANISHELRNPLNAVIGFGRVLERASSALSDKQLGYLTAITDAGQRMLRLVDDLAQLRAVGEEPLTLEPVDVASVVREVAGAFEEPARSQGIQLAVQMPGSPAYARANRAALAQALTNLVSNALKFTPEGGEVAIGVRMVGSRLELAVRDTGCGIAPEDQPQLFDYLERAGAKHAHHMKGSGVGLALVKALVVQQGGEVSVESALGHGSTFKLTLDVAS